MAARLPALVLLSVCEPAPVSTANRLRGITASRRCPLELFSVWVVDTADRRRCEAEPASPELWPSVSGSGGLECCNNTGEGGKARSANDPAPAALLPPPAPVAPRKRFIARMVGGVTTPAQRFGGCFQRSRMLNAYRFKALAGQEENKTDAPEG